MKRFLFVLTVLVIAACAGTSPPIYYLQLSAGDEELPQSDDPVIYLDAIAVPDYMLRDELLVRDSAYSIRYLSSHRWAEPIDLGIQRVLATRLESVTGSRQVISFPDVPRKPTDWNLRVVVRHFEAAGNEVQLSAEGRLERAEATQGASAVISFEDRALLASDDAEVIAARMSELLWRFTDELAAAIKE
ncbi:MAG: PqiC family protein [Pseudomonadota bacterium]